jgi:hypothetical protein
MLFQGNRQGIKAARPFGIERGQMNFMDGLTGLNWCSGSCRKQYKYFLMSMRCKSGFEVMLIAILRMSKYVLDYLP